MLGFSSVGEVALAQLQSDTSDIIVAEAGTITIAGQEVGLYASFVMSAEAGAFAITGQAASFERTFKRLNVRPSGGSRGLSAIAGGGSKGLRISA